jgi:hypothetical protein
MKYLCIASVLTLTLASATAFSLPNPFAALRSSKEQALPDDYQSRPAGEKLDILFDKCVSSGAKGTRFAKLETLLLFVRNMDSTFDHQSDERPWKYVKPIHAMGPVVKADFKASDSPHPFTGSFKGNPSVLMRFSAAKTPTDDNLTTAVAVKFMRSGMRSGNIFVMFSLDGQDSPNFFKNELSNVLPLPEGTAVKVVSAKFRTGHTKTANKVGVSDVAAYDASGKQEETVVSPYQVFMRPNSELDGTTLEGAYDIGKGTKLYDLYGTEGPDSEPLLIGSFVTTSDMVGSLYGDRKLFFQHQRHEEDIAGFEGKCPFSK